MPWNSCATVGREYELALPRVRWRCADGGGDFVDGATVSAALGEGRVLRTTVGAAVVVVPVISGVLSASCCSGMATIGRRRCGWKAAPGTGSGAELGAAAGRRDTAGATGRLWKDCGDRCSEGGCWKCCG